MNFKEQLKKLHQQAKAETQAREAEKAMAKAQQREAEPDFAALMADVKPIKNTQRYVSPRDLSAIKVRDKRAEMLAETQYFYVGDGQISMDIPATFSKNGQGAKDIKRLQAGYWTVVADVDLHGYTQEEAQNVLNEFIEFVQRRGVCGEIIHGSGLGSSGYTPVLKSLVRRWLMQHPDVLAYCEPFKGNDGAVRILLKRRFKMDNPLNIKEK